MTEKSI